MAPAERHPLRDDELINKVMVECEQAKGRMYEVPGKDLNFTEFVVNNGQDNVLLACPSVSQIDQNYQMVDGHLEEGLRHKIQSFEYVDFSRLISRNRHPKDEEGQRLEIVNRNGMSFLSPVTDNGLSINSYFRWEQAFRIYSNVLTSKFPQKATELFQYGHTIQTASMSYAWENVYAYDREFRQHIARNPLRTWGVILQ